MVDKKLESILQQVQEYIDEKQANRTWEAGKDFVNYAGNYYDHAEYVAGVKSLLDGWLAMGMESRRFESKFPRLFGKPYGILTNSGSSGSESNWITITSTWMSPRSLVSMPLT